MRFLSRLLFLAMLLTPLAALGQLEAIPTVSSSSSQQAKLSWTSNTPTSGQVACSATNLCTFTIYRCAGTSSVCTLTSTNWTDVTTTSSAATGYTDNPGIGTWSYVVQPTLVSDGTTGAASNIVTLTLVVPLLPAPVTASGTAGL